MRMTAFLMLIVCLHVAAKGVSQVVSIKAKDQPLKSVFVEMSKQTGVSILYNEKELQHAKPVSLYVKNVPLKEVLADLLKDQQLEFKVQNDIIFIERKKVMESFPPPVAPALDSNMIEAIGIVLNDDTQMPIENVTVTVKGSKQGTMTNAGGSYSIKGVPRNAVLVVSCVGYVPQEVYVDAEKGGKNGINFIKLKPHVSQLDETVVQAYGTTTKRKTTGNIITVKGEDIAKQPTLNPLLALQGKVSGLEITQLGGNEFGAVKVEIRGRKPINQNFTSDPLYIVDGVPITVLEVSKDKIIPPNGLGNAISRGLDQSAIGPLSGINPLATINPADIASIEVLKDADATAIYGSRGANGVILITTKKGKVGSNRFNVSVQQGISFVTGHQDLLNTPEYVAMRREAFKNDGLTPSAAPGTGYAPDILRWDTTRYTDWQKFFLNNQGKTTEVKADMSGGADVFTYRVGAGYNRTTDITTVKGASSRATLALSMTTQSRDQRLKGQVSATYSSSVINGVTNSPRILFSPNAPSLYDSAGHLNYAGYRPVSATVLEQVASKYKVAESRPESLTGSFNLSYTILKGLEARTNFGYSKSQSNSKSTSPIAAQDPLATNKFGSASFGSTRNSSWQIEPQLEYNSALGRKGKLNVLVGGTLQTVNSATQLLLGFRYTSDVLLNTINNAAEVKATDASAQYKYAGAFTRVGYTWDEKYILNLSARRDGSSRFGLGHQFGNFGSLGAAWIISDESWVREKLPAFISFVKLRGSYGVTGSDQVGEYQYLTQWGVAGDGIPISSAYNGISALLPQIQANADFHWQTTRKLEGAFDVALLDDRISLEAAWYRDRCDNQLIGYPTPLITGFNTVTANSPASVQNSGWEFLVNARAIDQTDFSWNVGFNISFNRNVLLDFPNLDKSPYLYRYKIGQPLGQNYFLHYLGINPADGSLQFEDHNHDGVVASDYTFSPGTGRDDRSATVNLSPEFLGGLNNTVRWKGLTLSADFSFTKRQAPQVLINDNPGIVGNITRWAYENRWTHPGQTDAKAPRLSTIQRITSFSNSDGFYTDASYVRLRTVVVSYSLPSNICRNLHFSSLSASLRAQNLFVITPYKGADPEVTSINALPLARTINAGLTCGF